MKLRLYGRNSAQYYGNLPAEGAFNQGAKKVATIELPKEMPPQMLEAFLKKEFGHNNIVVVCDEGGWNGSYHAPVFHLPSREVAVGFLRKKPGTSSKK